MMKKFSLEEYLKNPDWKVVTKSGDEVTIIYTKANKEWPVVAMINSSINPGFVWQFSVDGESMPDNDGSVYYGGLFFADEEEEMTEFEEAVGRAMFPGFFPMETFPAMNEAVKSRSNELLELARAETLKDLPNWKKTKPERGKSFGSGPWYGSGIMHDNGKHVVFFRGYEISVDELFDKLPKED